MLKGVAFEMLIQRYKGKFFLHHTGISRSKTIKSLKTGKKRKMQNLEIFSCYPVPSDCHLFRSIQNGLCGKRFTLVECNFKVRYTHCLEK